MEARNRLLMAVVLGGSLLLVNPAPICAQLPPAEQESKWEKIEVEKPAPGQFPTPASPPVPPQNQILPPPQAALNADVPPRLPPPAAEPGEHPLPINLPTALKLANVRAWDITIASQQLRIAAAQLQGARALWLPNVIAGTAYSHHDGSVQATDGALADATKSSLFAGAAPLMVLSTADAIYMPLAQRQVRRAQEANVQTATNDTITQVVLVYFDALEARADLAAIEDVAARAAALVHKTETLVPGLVPDVELARVRAVYANVEQTVQLARRRWRVASAEVARVLRLNATTLIEPIEPPQLQITLVSPARGPDELIPIAQQLRPELTFNEAQVAAAEERLHQEQMRPFLPILVVRGSTTPTPYPFAAGAYGGGSGGSLGNFGVTSQWDLEAVWEVKNMGFGNRALIRERQNNLAVARSLEARFMDVIAREVVQTWADIRSADQRTGAAERELKQALISATKNLEGLGEVKRAGGNLVILVIRPLEVVAALQALSQAYYNYFGTIADYNRAQFQMYRALGNPAQMLEGHDGLCGPHLPVSSPAAAPKTGP